MNTKKLRNYKRNSTACRQGFGVSAKRRRELKNIERKNLRLALKYIPKIEDLQRETTPEPPKF
jgi:hypothetical protein